MKTSNPPGSPVAVSSAAASPLGNPKRGRRRREIIEFPEASAAEWEEPTEFHLALDLHLRRHGDSFSHLKKALSAAGFSVESSTIRQWARGLKRPGSVTSLAILNAIEIRYRLPEGYFRGKLGAAAKAKTGHKKLNGIKTSERRRLAWHLPEDFDLRSPAERREILEWVRTVVLSGSTEFRRYQAEAMKHRYALRFENLGHDYRGDARKEPQPGFLEESGSAVTLSPRAAPHGLSREIEALVRFKTATLTDVGFERTGVWNDETAFQKIEHLGLLFGALAAPPEHAAAGLGVPRECLALGMLVFPAVWDWYVQWRERRRGFFTVWEVNMLVSIRRRPPCLGRQRALLSVLLRVYLGAVGGPGDGIFGAGAASAMER